MGEYVGGERTRPFSLFQKKKNVTRMNGPPDKRRRATSSTLYFKPRHTHTPFVFFFVFFFIFHTQGEGKGAHIDQYDMLCIQHITRIKK